MTELTLVTVCRGRLSQLLKTLPAMWASDLPVIVVDYDCPDLGDPRSISLEEKFKGVKVVRSGPRPYMNLNEARNIGVRAVETPVVLVIDADILIKAMEFREYAERILFSKNYVIVRPPNQSLSGTAMFRLSDYVAVGGYDETMNRYGAGYDEIDFYHKLGRVGVQPTHFASDLFEHLPHEGRSEHYPMNHRGLSDQLNYLYLAIKSELIGMLGEGTTELDPAYRIDLIDHIYQALVAGIRGGYAMSSFDVRLHTSLCGAISLTRTMHYGIDTSQILKKCELTRDQFDAIVERVDKALSV